MNIKRAKALAIVFAVLAVLFFAAPSFARPPARPGGPGGFGQAPARGNPGHYVVGPGRSIGPSYRHARPIGPSYRRPFARPYARPYYRPYARAYPRPYYGSYGSYGSYGRPYAWPYWGPGPYYYRPYYPRPYAWWYPPYPSFFVPGLSFYFSF